MSIEFFHGMYYELSWLMLLITYCDHISYAPLPKTVIQKSSVGTIISLVFTQIACPRMVTLSGFHFRMIYWSEILQCYYINWIFLNQIWFWREVCCDSTNRANASRHGRVLAQYDGTIAGTTGDNNSFMCQRERLIFL